MPILTPGFGSIDQHALAFVLGGCGKKQSQQQSMGPVVVNCPPCQCAAAPPPPVAAAPAPSGGDSINTSVQIAGY